LRIADCGPSAELREIREQPRVESVADQPAEGWRRRAADISERHVGNETGAGHSLTRERGSDESR